MQDKLKISDLYEDNTISGETYLFCVENNISFVEDIVSTSLDAATDNVLSELNELKENYSNKNYNTKEHSLNNTNNFDTNTLDRTSYDDYFNKKYETANSAIKNYITELMVFHGGKSELIQFLLSVRGKSDFKSAGHKLSAKTNTILDIAYELQTLGLRYSIYDELYKLCTDVRSRNAIKRHEIYNVGNKLEFINWVLSCTTDNISRLYGVGKKSVNIIWEIFTYLRSLSENNYYVIPEIFSNITNENKDSSNINNKLYEYTSLLESKRYQLSTRANNVLDAYLKDKTYEELFASILEDDFSSFRGCGSKTENELKEFFKTLLFITTSPTSYDIKYLIDFEKYKKVLPFQDTIISKIIEKKEELNYFPLFYVIQEYIEFFQYRESIILHNLIDIYDNQEIKSLDYVASEIDLTRERVRQLRKKVLKNIREFILSLRDLLSDNNYTRDNIQDINNKECSNFQDNFIYWTLSLINNKWTYIGNIEEVFFNPHGHQINLNLVPTDLYNCYDFKNFIKSIQIEFNKKRSNDIEIDLDKICLKYFKGTIHITILNEIINECKRITLRLFDAISKDNTIILKRNVYRGLSDIAEEILRNYGAPMSSEQIYRELAEKYPNQRCKNINSLNAGIRSNPNISIMGRSGIYTLKEWNTGVQRGGTIREFAEEYILSTNDKIAKLEDIGNYVRQFRETTTDNSIQANLLAETTGRFKLYIKDNERFFGLSGKEYDKTFILGEESLITVRTFETSKKLFIEFITKHRRFPFREGKDINEEESKLARWWDHLNYRIKKGNFTAEELEGKNYIFNSFGHLYIQKKDYKWRQEYNEIYQKLQKEGQESLNINQIHWVNKNLQLYNSSKLKDWQNLLMLQILMIYNA